MFDETFGLSVDVLPDPCAISCFNSLPHLRLVGFEIGISGAVTNVTAPTHLCLNTMLTQQTCTYPCLIDLARLRIGRCAAHVDDEAKHAALNIVPRRGNSAGKVVRLVLTRVVKKDDGPFGVRRK